MLVGFGEMEVTTELSGAPLTLFMSVEFPASVGIQGNQVRIDPTDDPEEITLETEVVVEPDVAGAEPLIANIEELLQIMVVPMLFEDGLVFNVPGFVFGALVLPGMGDAPFALTDPEIALDGRRGEHVTIRADLRPEEPAE